MQVQGNVGLDARPEARGPKAQDFHPKQKIFWFNSALAPLVPKKAAPW